MRTTGIWLLLGVTSIALLGTSAAWSQHEHRSPGAPRHRGAVSSRLDLRRSMGALLAFTPAPAAPVEAPLAASPRVAHPHVAPPVVVLVEDELPPPEERPR